MNYSKGEMHIHSLFPTAIGETVRSVTSEEHQFFAELLNKPVKENIGNTFTEENHVLDNTRLSNLKNDLTDITNEYFQKVYRPTNDVEIYITISWVNYTKQGEFHHNHCHGNSIISGVYYIDTDDDDTNRYFAFYKNGSSGSGTELLKINEDGDVLPGDDNTQDLGASDKRWANVYSGDVHLNNTGLGGNEVDGSEGSWTMQEGANDLFLINRITGKKYKFNLTEV